MGINEVERAIRKGQVFSIALDESTLQICQSKTPLRYAHGRVGQIDPCVMGAGPSEAFRLAAASAANFQHPQATGFLKAHRRL
jgi:hypothetical protein